MAVNGLEKRYSDPIRVFTSTFWSRLMIIVCPECGGKNRVPEDKLCASPELWSMPSAFNSACAN